MKFSNIQIAFVVFIHFACSSFWSSPKTFSDVQSLESQVRNYREWIQSNGKELQSLKTVLSSILGTSLRSNFPFYEEIDKEITVMEESIVTISEIAREQKKLVLQLQRNYDLRLSSEYPGESISFLDKFILNHERVGQQQEIYSISRESLVKIFKKKNQKLVFIQDQVRNWYPTIQSLRLKRNQLIPRIEKLTELAATELAYSASEKTVEKLANQSQKVETISKQLDIIEKSLNMIKRIAENEINGLVYLGLMGDPPKDYEKQVKDQLNHYVELLQTLDRILPE